MTIPKRRFKKADFNNLFKKGKTIAGELVFLKLRRNSLENSRFCFVVNLKTSKKATVRNKIKRQLKDITRKNFKNIKPGFDVAIIAKPGIISEGYQKIEKEVKDLFKRTKFYKHDQNNFKSN